MVIQLVYGNSLEDRLDQLLYIPQNRTKIKIKIVSMHIHDATINGDSFKDKLKKLINSGATIIIIIDKGRLTRDKIEQQLVDDLDQMGVKIFPKRNIHAKVVLLESTNRNSMLLSSLNITNNALHNNKEAGIFIENEFSNLLSDMHNYVASILSKS